MEGGGLWSELAPDYIFAFEDVPNFAVQILEWPAVLLVSDISV